LVDSPTLWSNQLGDPEESDPNRTETANPAQLFSTRTTLRVLGRAHDDGEQ